MKIAVCGSMAFAKEMVDVSTNLKRSGHVCFIPHDAIGHVTGKIKKDSSSEGIHKKIAKDLIRRHHKLIQKSDAILVLNYDKKGTKNYIGGNTFLEMGFAHVLRKPIYLLNPIPDMNYTDEIIAMQPIILDGSLSKIGRR